MDTQKVIEGLNKDLSMEYAAIIQTMQHAFLMQGYEREFLAGMLVQHAQESLMHAKMLGDKIVALGGVPTVEVGRIRQSTDTREMLEQDLEMHNEVIANLNERPQQVQDDAALRVMIEQAISEEVTFMEKLEKILSMKKIAVAEKDVQLRKTAVG